MRSFDRDLATFADELVVEARQAEADALAQARSGGREPGGTRAERGCAEADVDRRTQAARQASPGVAGPPPAAAGPAMRRTASAQDAGAPAAATAPAAPAAAPARARPEPSGVAPSPRRRAMCPGELVAAQTGGEGGDKENWIVASFVGLHPGGRVEVQDDEAEPDSVNRHVLEAGCVLALPRSASARDERPLPPGSRVLGVFPDTTTFYRAVVVHPPRRLPGGEYDTYTLQFEDDEQTGEGRLVPFVHVILAPN